MPSWLSSTGFMFIPILLIAVGLTWITIIAIEKFSALAYFFGAFAALFFTFVRVMWGQLWGTAPLLRIGSEGVSARILKGQTIAWEDISEICYKYSGKGSYQLAIHLVPHPTRRYKHKHPFLYVGMNPRKYAIPLNALRTSDVNRVRDVAKAACARYNKALEQPDVALFQPNPTFEWDWPEAASPSILRWASRR
jgi:hypothetical protein